MFFLILLQEKHFNIQCKKESIFQREFEEKKINVLFKCQEKILLSSIMQEHRYLTI